jgi:hypothetical protein
MRSLVFALALGALAVPAVAQPPPSLMSRLDRYCIATRGQGDAAIRAARADGFVAPPREAIPNLPPEMQDLQAVWAVHEGGVVLLMTGEMNDRRSQMKGSVCAVASMPPSPAAQKDLEAWLGMPVGGQRYAIYAEDDQGRRRALQPSDERAAREALRNDQLRAAGAMTQKEMTMLLVISMRL